MTDIKLFRSIAFLKKFFQILPGGNTSFCEIYSVVSFINSTNK